MLKRKEFILGAAAGLTIAAAATAGGVISWPGAHAESRPGQIVASAGAAGLAFAPPQGAPLSFADIVQQVAPAVVQIEVETVVERPRGGIQIPGFPGFVIPGQPQQQDDPNAEPETATGAGSGFFISADGYIVTNNHVVADARSIKVKMSDGRTLDATLVGRDENTDLAVIKVQGTDFKFVTFEEQADPRVGDWVVAVGNPFGLGGTATAGIVSARGRDLQDRTTSAYVDYMQIDAAINRGNSGGPTFDIYGRVIGVNSAIYSPSGGSVGIGFAIPASTAKSITDRLIRDGSVERGYIGVQIGDLDEGYRASLGLPADAKGALVQSVTPDGPADKGGIQTADVIVSVNGEATDTRNALTRAVGNVPVGSPIRMEVIRDGRHQTLTIRSGRRPSDAELYADDENGDANAPKPTPAEPSGMTVEGLTLSPMTPALKRQYSIGDGVSGLVVTNVAPQSKAGEAHLPAGIVISRAFNRPVSTPNDFKAAVDAARAAGRSHILLSLVVDGSPRLYPLELGKAN